MSVSRQSRRGRQAGFTLVELMTVLLIAAILLGIGVPSLREAFVRNALSSKVNEFVGAMQLARSEAISRGVSVTVCRIDPADAELDACDGSGGWQNGWLMFADTDADGVKDAGEDVLGSSGAAASDFTFKDTIGALAIIRFRPDGTDSVTASASRTLKICLGAEHASSVVLSRTGRPVAQAVDPAASPACP